MLFTERPRQRLQHSTPAIISIHKMTAIRQWQTRSILRCCRHNPDIVSWKLELGFDLIVPGSKDVTLGITEIRPGP